MDRKRFPLGALGASLLALLLMAAPQTCGTVPTVAAPTITSFTVSPPAITAGQAATLAWSTSGATTVTITGMGTVATSGSTTVNPAETANYTVTAANSAGSVNRQVTVTVTAPPSDPTPPAPTPPTQPTVGPCEPLPPASGNIVTVSTADDLRNAVANAGAGTTILVADGTYTGVNLQFSTAYVTLRSQSGNRDAVVIDGSYMINEIIQVYAAHVTIADLTLEHATFHPVHAGGGGDYLTLYNLHIVDGGEQFVKVNPDDSGTPNDYGTLACSTLEMTQAGREFVQTSTATDTGYACYTGGIDAHAARGWEIRDNTIENIYCTTGLAQHAINFWNSSRDTVVERNRILNNARGIGFGLGDTVDTNLRLYPDDPLAGTGLSPNSVQHIGGVIRNNFVFATIPQFDTAIGLEQSWNTRIYHNTVFSTVGGLGIDVRFPNSNPIVENNLATPGIDLRDGGQVGTGAGNIAASASMFVDAANGDLHLVSSATTAINKGVSTNGAVVDDIDAALRDSLPDIGADEYGATLSRARRGSRK